MRCDYGLDLVRLLVLLLFLLIDRLNSPVVERVCAGVRPLVVGLLLVFGTGACPISRCRRRDLVRAAEDYLETAQHGIELLDLLDLSRVVGPGLATLLLASRGADLLHYHFALALVKALPAS